MGVRRVPVGGSFGVLAVVLAVGALGVPGAVAATQACTGDPHATQALTLPVQGQQAQGLYTLPAHPARTLVVFGHGYSYNDYAWVAHMTNAATLDGAIAVTMNYRGLTNLPADSTGYPRSRGWPVSAGAQDLIAAGRYFDATCGPFDRIILLGISMGGNSTGLAAAAQGKRIEGQPLFDYWVGIEGVYNLTELYNEAALVAPTNQFAANAKKDIEAETGGTPAQVPQAYTARTVVDHATEIAASGLKGVYIVHAVNDGEAAYNQAQEMTSGLRSAGLPTDLYSVSRHAPGDDRNIDTTLAASPVSPGAPADSAGHEAEWSTHDITLDTGFDRITALLVRGEPPPCNRDFSVDGMSNPQITPDPSQPAPGCPAGQALGAPASASPPVTSGARCSVAGRVTLAIQRGHRHLVLRGRTRESRCSGRGVRVKSVSVALARSLGASGRCRFLLSRGGFSRARSCARPVFLRARYYRGGRRRDSWRLILPRPPRGTYRLLVTMRQSSAPSVRLERRLPLA